VLIDTSVLIAYFEPADATHQVAAVLIDEFVRTGRNAAIVSPITVMEVLVRPLRVQPASAQHVHDFLTHWPNLTLLSTDLHIAQEAASLRATYHLKAPDALIVATGIVAQVGHLMTNDADWTKKLAQLKSRIEVTTLRPYA